MIAAIIARYQKEAHDLAMGFIGRSGTPIIESSEDYIKTPDDVFLCMCVDRVEFQAYGHEGVADLVWVASNAQIILSQDYEKSAAVFRLSRFGDEFVTVGEVSYSEE